MWRHNLLLTFRNFKRNKTSFFINLIGLSTGLACVFLIYLWVNDELHVDKFHEKDRQLYQVMQNRPRKDGIVTSGSTPAYFSKAILEQIPEIENAVPVNNDYTFLEKGIVKNAGQAIQAQGLCAGPDYFNVFSYPVLQGDKNRLLADKYNIAISERLAIKLFGTTDNIIGSPIEWDHDSFNGEFTVAGVFKEPPVNSTAQFDVIFNIELILDAFEESREWTTDAAKTFLVVKKGADINRLNKKLTTLLQSKPYRAQSTLFVQQYSSRYLYGNYENGVQIGGRITYVKLFSIIGLFILIIACVNFMNLSTAKASIRMKEVGIKKATGASRRSLITQFLFESIALSFLAAFVAIQIVALLLPQFSQIAGKEFQIGVGSTEILTIGGIILFTGLTAGIYPAFYLAAFQPIKGLKNNPDGISGENWVRKGLVVFQFVLSVIFIVGVLTIHKQIEFVQHKQLGYDKENVISFVSRGAASTSVEPFLMQLRNLPGVAYATNLWGGSFLKNKSLSVVPSWEGQTPEQKILVPRPHVGHDFIETLGIKLKEGRSFSKEYAYEETKVIVNDAAVKLMGLDKPVGSILKRGEDEVQIIGVVENFHMGSLHEQIKPVFIRYLPGGKDILLKIKPGASLTILHQIKSLYEEFHNGFPFEVTFLEPDYQRLYEAESRVAVLSNYAAGVAIIISCLGLFGLALFTAERRRKEIGIRKVLGASIVGVVGLLSKDYLKLIMIALLIASPLAYFLMERWLTGFAYRITIEWWVFALAGLFAVSVAFLTVSFQSVKAALANPVESLRSE